MFKVIGFVLGVAIGFALMSFVSVVDVPFPTWIVPVVFGAVIAKIV